VANAVADDSDSTSGDTKRAVPKHMRVIMALHAPPDVDSASHKLPY